MLASSHCLLYINAASEIKSTDRDVNQLIEMSNKLAEKNSCLELVDTVRLILLVLIVLTTNTSNSVFINDVDLVIPTFYVIFGFGHS